MVSRRSSFGSAWGGPRLLALIVTLSGVALDCGEHSSRGEDEPAREKARFDEDTVRAAREAGLKWLTLNQNPDGSFGSHQSALPNEVAASGLASHQAFKVATTALCVLAIQDSMTIKGYQEDSLGRGVRYILGAYDVPRQNGLEHYNVWASAYSLQALSRAAALTPDRATRDQCMQACTAIVGHLIGQRDCDGGWGYVSVGALQTHPPTGSTTTATTAAVLVSLGEAAKWGVGVPPGLVESGLISLQQGRMPDGHFAYSQAGVVRPASAFNLPPGAAARTPACLLALLLHNPELVEGTACDEALRSLLIRHAHIQEAGLRRPIPHESWFGVSGYYYLFGHAYAAELLGTRPQSVILELVPELARAVLRCQQADGSFWDYPLYRYHKPYGTAFALRVLARVDKLKSARIPLKGSVLELVEACEPSVF